MSHIRQRVREILQGNEAKCHPGLMMDKLLTNVLPGQKEVGAELERIQNATTFHREEKDNKDLFDALNVRRSQILQNARSWNMRTSSPMALHLARAALLENANVCLHRTYGFAYLPGSGLKGMARAWAVTVWTPPADETRSAADIIKLIFGGAGEDEESDGHAGCVIFHDAWPTTWPQLRQDVLTNHHSTYYQDDTGANPPGDWESPIPVKFLTVPAGTQFSFALSCRSNEDPALLGHAEEILKGALTHAGAGAKTNAGYGAFVPVEGSAPAMPTKLQERSYTCELELVTPAFLAGAQQGLDDCELRGATLRGQLRWWWRTMHAAHLGTAQLRALEEVIWGSASKGGAVKLQLLSSSDNKPAILAPWKKLDQKKLVLDNAFVKRHGIPVNNGAQVTPGLSYLAYGMSEYSSKQQEWKRRACLLPPAFWRLSITARSTIVPDVFPDAAGATILAEDVKGQALAALGLLTTYGAVGSRSRKGFGSLILHDDAGSITQLNIATGGAMHVAAHFRQQLGQGLEPPGEPETPSLGAGMFFSTNVSVQAANEWQIMHHVGCAFRDYASSFKHDPSKLALGLPRKIHGPLLRPIGRQSPASHRSPIELAGLQAPADQNGIVKGRHPAPLFVHVGLSDNGYTVRVSAFPDRWLMPSGSQPSLIAHKVEMLKALQGIQLKLKEPIRP